MDEQQNSANTSNSAAPNPTQSAAPQHNTLMAVLAYLGFLVIISYVVAKDDPFVKFHIKQGLVLFSIEVIVWIAMSMFWMTWMLWPIAQLINLGTLILAILGIVNVVNNQQKELPLVGHLSHMFKI